MRFSNQMRRPSAAVLLLILLTAPQACKRKQPQIPLPPQQLPAPAPEPPPAEITISPGEPVVAPPVEVTPPPVEPQPVEPSVPEPKSEQEPSVPAVEPEAAPEPLPPPAPSLTPLLSPREQTRYRAETDASLARARRSLGILAQRQLTAEQQTSLNRVRTFISQAETVRSRDLATAAGLARRADILSAELVSNTQ